VTVICGDSLLELAKLPPASIDALVSDPPYSSGGMVRGDRAGAPLQKYVNSENHHRYAEDFAGDGRDQRGFQLWCALWIATVLPALKDGAPFALFIDWRNLPALCDAAQAGGLVWRGIFVWDKTEGVRPQKGRPRSQAEYVVWGSKGPWREYDGAPCLPGVFRCGNVTSKQREHIAQKPLELMRLLVQLAPPPRDSARPILRSRLDACGCGGDGAHPHRN